MAYLTNMRKTCTDRATNPEYPLTLLDSIRGEFDKALNGGIFDASYVLSKLVPLTRHVKWMEGQAEIEWQAQVEDDHAEEGEALPEFPDELDEPEFYQPGGGIEG